MYWKCRSTRRIHRHTVSIVAYVIHATEHHAEGQIPLPVYVFGLDRRQKRDISIAFSDGQYRATMVASYAVSKNQTRHIITHSMPITRHRLAHPSILQYVLCLIKKKRFEFSAIAAKNPDLMNEASYCSEKKTIKTICEISIFPCIQAKPLKYSRSTAEMHSSNTIEKWISNSLIIYNGQREYRACTLPNLSEFGRDLSK